MNRFNIYYKRVAVFNLVVGLCTCWGLLYLVITGLNCMFMMLVSPMIIASDILLPCLLLLLAALMWNFFKVGLWKNVIYC